MLNNIGTMEQRILINDPKGTHHALRKVFIKGLHCKVAINKPKHLIWLNF